MPEDDSEAAVATTNYGSQVRYNYGQISNYFCHSSSVAHQCHFPEVSEKGSLSGLIAEARQLHDEKLWAKAKLLFGQVLASKEPAPTTAELVVAQYHIAREHFALAEFHEAAQLSRLLAYDQEGHCLGDSASGTGSSPSDSHYWLARSLFFLKKYEEASKELQTFIGLYDQEACNADTDKLHEVTEGKLWLGLTFERQGQYEGARMQLSDAVQQRTRVLGSEHLQTLACRHHLANFLYARKDFVKARQHFQALLNSEERLSGPEQGEAMKTRCMFALCLANLGKYNDAEPHLQRLRVWYGSLETVPKTESVDQGLVLYWLGRVHLHRRGNDPPEKETALLFHEALKIISTVVAEEKDGGKHLQNELRACRRHNARGLAQQGHFAAAEQMFCQNITDLESSSYQDEELVANLCGLAFCALRQCRRPEAVMILEIAVNRMAPLKGCVHTGEDLASCLQLLGNMLVLMGHISHGNSYLQQVVDDIPAKPTKRYNLITRDLGISQFRLRQFEGALTHIQAAYDSFVTNFPSTSVENTEIWLSFVKCETGDWDGAEAHLHSAATSMLSSPKTGNDLKSWIHYYTARIALHRNRFEEAFNCFCRAADMFRRLHGPNNIDYVLSRYFEALALYRQKK